MFFGNARRSSSVDSLARVITRGIDGHLPPCNLPCQENAFCGEITNAKSLDGTVAAVERPDSPDTPVSLFYRRVIDACNSPPHESFGIKFPQLDAVRPKPLVRIVMPFVFETYRDPIVVKRPKRFLQPVIQFSSPLAIEKRFDLLAP